MDGFVLEVIGIIESIFIINEEGETEVSISLGKFQTEEALFGGFLSAIQMFSQKISGTEIEGILFGDYRMIVRKSNNYFLVTVHAKSDKKSKGDNDRVFSIFQKNIIVGITDELVDLLRQSATQLTGMDSASDWASRML